MKKLLTVIIPFSEKHKHLYRNAMQSVLDHSSPEERELIDIIPVYDKPCKGQWARTNDVVRSCNTEWCTKLDADDEWRMWRGRMTRLFILQSLKDVSDIIYTDCQNDANYYHSQVFSITELRKRNFIPLSTVFFRTAIAKEIPFIEKKHRGLDRYWYALVFQKYKRFTYYPGATIKRRTDVSNFQSNIPIYRKLHRKYYHWKIRRMIDELAK